MPLSISAPAPLPTKLPPPTLRESRSRPRAPPTTCSIPETTTPTARPDSKDTSPALTPSKSKSAKAPPQPPPSKNCRRNTLSQTPALSCDDSLALIGAGLAPPAQCVLSPCHG